MTKFPVTIPTTADELLNIIKWCAEQNISGFQECLEKIEDDGCTTYGEYASYVCDGACRDNPEMDVLYTAIELASRIERCAEEKRTILVFRKEEEKPLDIKGFKFVID